MFLSGRIICKFAIAIPQGKHYIPKAFSLIPTRSNRQFIRKRSLSETLALAIIWASAHTIAVRAVCTFDSFSFEGFGEPDLVNETKGGSHFRVFIAVMPSGPGQWEVWSNLFIIKVLSSPRAISEITLVLTSGKNWPPSCREKTLQAPLSPSRHTTA